MAKAKGRENAPGRGNKTPADVEAIFAAEYLRTGIVSLSAKKAKIPQPTGYELADRLEADEEFVKRRRHILTRGLDRVESMLIRGCETASKRIQKKPIVTEMGVTDNGHNYLRAISDAHRSLVQRRKVDADITKSAEPAQIGPLEVVITRAKVSEKSDDPDAEG